MNARHTLYWVIPTLIGFAATAPSNAAGRDPFWPIGYSHPLPTPPAQERAEAPQQPVAAPAPPTKPEPPKEKPVTETDWTNAKKTLTVSGVTRSVNPATNVSRTFVMINRRMYAAGEAVTCVSDNIRFQWSVDIRPDNALVLTPLKAERIKPPAPLSK